MNDVGLIRERGDNDYFVQTSKGFWREFAYPNQKPIGPTPLGHCPVVGRLPPDQLDATEWREEYRLPPDWDTADQVTWSGANWQALHLGCFSQEDIDRKRNACADIPNNNDTIPSTARELEYKKQLAAERRAREKAESRVSDRCDQIRNLERNLHKESVACAEYKQRWNEVEAAFRAATGEDYEPGRDYVAEKQADFDVALAAEFYNDSKGVSMSLFTKFFKATPKYVALFALFSVLSNPMAIYEWWQAPTQLEVGDWTRVVSCETCSAVTTDRKPDLCRKCGGESFVEKKAQKIMKPATFADNPYHWWMSSKETGDYRFADGTTTLKPGNWEIKE